MCQSMLYALLSVLYRNKRFVCWFGCWFCCFVLFVTQIQWHRPLFTGAIGLVNAIPMSTAQIHTNTHTMAMRISFKPIECGAGRAQRMHNDCRIYIYIVYLRLLSLAQCHCVGTLICMCSKHNPIGQWEFM